MNELTYEQMKGVDARFEEDISETFDHEKSVEMRAAKGGLCVGAGQSFDWHDRLDDGYSESMVLWDGIVKATCFV